MSAPAESLSGLPTDAAALDVALRALLERKNAVVRAGYGRTEPAIGISEVAAAKASIAELARDFDAAALTAGHAAVVVSDVAAMTNMLAGIGAAAATRVAESGVWKTAGARSAEVWLAGKTGTSASQARDALATAQRLAGLPETAAAARRGELSPAQLLAVADAAATDPAKETELLAAARREPLGVLRERCLSVKRAADTDPEANYRRLRAQRCLTHGVDTEGMWWLRMRTTTDDGARITPLLDQISDELFHAARRDGRREPREAYAADAMVTMAERAVTGGTGGKIPERFLTLIRVDAAALQRGATEGAELCEIPGVGPIPVSVARDALPDSVLKLVITRGVDVANVTSLGRGLSAAQQWAAYWTQPLCSREGCGNRRGLENDHRAEYRYTRHTRLDENDPLCGPDHDLKTYHGWALTDGTGTRPMVGPDDPRHPKNKPPPQPDG